MKHKFVFLFPAVLLGWMLYAQTPPATDTLAVKVYFPPGSSCLEPRYRDNGDRLDAFAVRFKTIQRDSAHRAPGIGIVAGASPEGRAEPNIALSEKRNLQIRSYLERRIAQDGLTFELCAPGVDWQELTALAETSRIPCKEEVLDVLHNAPDSIIFQNTPAADSLKHRLETIQAGRVWQYMAAYLFPELHSARVTIVYDIATEPVVETDTLLRTPFGWVLSEQE